MERETGLSRGSEDDHDHLHYHGVDSAEKHLSVSEALKIFLQEIKKTKPETVPVSDADNRILFSDLNSSSNLPKLARSTRDGYAINVNDPGDTKIQNRSFAVVGEVRIGTISDLIIHFGEAAKIATGSYVPDGANSIIMKEYSKVEDGKLTISRPVKIGENILVPGEDLKKDQLLLKHGTRLRPYHLALLSLVGVSRVKVFSKPRIGIFSTGDELEDSARSKRDRKHLKSLRSGTLDSNRPFLAAIISEFGGLPVDLGIARDNFEEIRKKMVRGLMYDGLMLSAGSSVGDRDFVSKAATSIKGLQMLVHGVAMRPSSPTGLAVYNGKPVIFLPGFPTSAIISFYIFGRPAILKASGTISTEMTTIKAVMDEDFNGKPGLTHFLRVRITREGDHYRASVVRPTEAQYSSWLREANGIAIVGTYGQTSLKKGQEVSVFLIGNIE